MTHIAVIDIGKTNAKLALVDPASMTEVAVITRPNRVLPGPPWPHFDLDGHWAFLVAGLTQFHRNFGISAISVTTHGAAAVLLDVTGGLAAPMLDYEHDGPDSVAKRYGWVRPGFAETGSPRLPLGLNVGAQLFWLAEAFPAKSSKARHVLMVAQYWAFRLSGVAASEA